MSKKPFPTGIVVTLVILWIGTLAAVAAGWYVMRQDTESRSDRPALKKAASKATSSGSARLPALTWRPEATRRFAIEVGGASLGAVLFLLLAVGAGFLMQEKIESLNE